VSVERDELWVRRFDRKVGPVGRVVCCPHAGGSASAFRPLSLRLPAPVELLAVQYPGRQDRLAEPVVDDLVTLAELVTEALGSWLDQPFVLFGHSMGATVAFEVARRLERMGVVPAGLFVSGRSPLPRNDEAVHLRDDDGLLREIKALSGTDDKVFAEEELVRMVLPAIRGDYRAVETYRYAPGSDVSCPIVALVGDTDPKVSPAEAAEWAKRTSGGFQLRVFPGGHFYLFDHEPAIAELIGGQLVRT
jgi:surfactin synthase thioesterase subunit